MSIRARTSSCPSSSKSLIGDMKLEDISPRIMDKYYRDLLSVKSVVVKNVKPRNEYLTPHTVREIHKVLRNAFNQAVKWELIEELKDLFGDEFIDFNLVFCSSNGKPIEGQVINRAFNKLIEENGLPKVVFHSLRHSSITYKLKLNGGDMKSVQGDSGHAQVKMVADSFLQNERT